MKMIGAHIPILDQSSLTKTGWESEVALHKKFVRITPENHGLFFALLGKEKDLDSYAISPVYYALTGRKGLWLYQDGNSYMPLCWHPNVEGQILVFPPRGVKNPQILKRLLAEIPLPPSGIRIARVKKDRSHQAWTADVQGTSDRSVMLIPIEELTLDWRYPARILSTETVSKMQGHDFMRIRNWVRQAQRNSITVEPLSRRHVEQLIKFTYRWANRRTNKADEIIDLIEPYKAILGLFKEESHLLDGLAFLIDGQIQAATIWEMPNNGSQMANSWVNLTNTQVKGLSEFMMKTLADTLLAQGILHMNLGGSETKGLDDYKKKFMPPLSVSMRSIEAVVEGNDFIMDALIRIQELRATA